MNRPDNLVIRAYASSVVTVAAAICLSAGCGSTASSSDLEDMASREASVRDMARIVRDLWEPTCIVKGSVVDENGKPVAGMGLQVCSAIRCATPPINSDGSFVTSQVPLHAYSVKYEESCANGSPRTGFAVTPVVCTMDGQVIDAGKLILPLLPNPGVALPDAKDPTPHALLAGDGLTLTLTGTELVPALGSTCNLAARLVPPEKHAPYTLPNGDRLLAAWVVSPFSAFARKPFPVSANLPVAVPPMSAVNFWTFSEAPTDSTYVGPVAGHADQAGTNVTTDPGTGILEISWVLVSAKP